jgi:bifunctional non-homologous end joining protein LigD
MHSLSLRRSDTYRYLSRSKILTRTGLDWTAKYPSIIAALSNLNANTAYIDGELRGVDESGLPSFA